MKNKKEKIQEWNIRKYELYSLARKEGDEKTANKIRNEMVMKNMGLVWAEVRRWRSRFPYLQGVDNDDLANAGAMGIMRSIEKFDDSKGTSLSTYATYWIKAYVRRTLGMGTVVTKKTSGTEGGAYLSLSEIKSLDEPIHSSALRIDRLRSESVESMPNARIEEMEKGKLLERAITVYVDSHDEEKREKIRKIVDLRINKHVPANAVAKIMGVSRQRINQYENFRGTGFIPDIRRIIEDAV